MKSARTFRMCESGTYQLITPSPFPETYIDLQSPNSSVQHSTAPMISLIFSPISVPSSLLTGLSLNHLLLLFQLLIFVCIPSLPRILFFFPFVSNLKCFIITLVISQTSLYLWLYPLIEITFLLKIKIFLII